MATLNIRIDDKLKKEAQKTFEDLGLDMSTAVKMFFSQTVSDQALPFMPARRVLTKAQQKALAAELKREVEETLREGRIYKNSAELFADLGI